MSEAFASAGRGRTGSGLAVLVALALACASAGGGAGGSAASRGGEPDWVATNRSAEFPPEAYVIGVGSGVDADSAGRAARAELSRVFDSRVESTIADTQTFLREQGQSQVIEKLEVDNRVQTRGDFEGVAVRATWNDRGKGMVWALAVLDKERERRRLEGQLREAVARVHGHLSRSDTATSSLDRSRALLDAVKASAERDQIVARASLVGRPWVDGLESTAQIASQLDAVLWNTAFEVQAVEVDAGGNPRGPLSDLREHLEKEITGMGFRVVAPGAGRPTVWVNARVSLEPIERGIPGTHFYRWEGAYEVSGQPPHGAVLIASEASGGESYSSPSLARKRALLKGSQRLSSDLRSKLSRYLNEGAGH